jgi:plastocyanin
MALRPLALTKTRALLPAGLLALGLLTAACSGNPGPASKTGAAPAAGGPTIKVGGTDQMRFNPAEIKVKAGETINIEFVNEGQILHDLTTRGQATNAYLVATPKGSRTGAFTAAVAGTYEFFCGQAGHEQAGMKGTLIVE